MPIRNLEWPETWDAPAVCRAEPFTGTILYEAFDFSHRSICRYPRGARGHPLLRWMQAASLLTATPAKVALICDTVTGPGPAATIVVKPVATLAGSTSIVVLMAPVGSGMVATPPASQVLNAANQSQGLTYTVSMAAGCSGAASGASVIRFYAGGTSDVSVPVTVSVTASASALAASPVTLTCVRNAGPPVSYTPGPAETVTVTSPAVGGTPFTVDTSANPPWLAVTPVTGGLAGPTGISFTVSAVSPCGNYRFGQQQLRVDSSEESAGA